MKYVLVILLILAPVQHAKASYADDALLAIAAQVMNYIIEQFKKLGEQQIGNARKASGKAQISAKKQHADIISDALMGAHINYITNDVKKNIGVGELVDSSYGSLRVSGIAPSGCMSITRAIKYRDIAIKKQEVKVFADDYLKDNFSIENMVSNYSNSNNTMKAINELVFSDDAQPINFFPSENTLIEDNGLNRNLIVAKSIKYAYKKVPTDIKNVEEDEFRKVLSSSIGQDWLSYNFASKAIFNTVYDAFIDNLEISQTSSSLENQKDLFYANSFKRTVANSIKYQSGSVMELVYFTNREMDAKIEEYRQLEKQRLLLAIIAMQRIRKFRKSM